MKQKSKVLKSISTTLVLQSSSKWFINNSLYKYNKWIYSADWSDPKSAAFNYFSLLALRILASQCHCWRSRRRCHHLRHAEASAVHEKITRRRLVPTSDPERKMDHYQQEERLFGVSQVLCDPATPPLPPEPLNSRLPSSESICYQIKRRASDSLLFSAAADLYAECKTDALCDTYLWWAPLSQDLL